MQPITIQPLKVQPRPLPGVVNGENRRAALCLWARYAAILIPSPRGEGGDGRGEGSRGAKIQRASRKEITPGRELESIVAMQRADARECDLPTGSKINGAFARDDIAGKSDNSLVYAPRLIYDTDRIANASNARLLLAGE